MLGSALNNQALWELLSNLAIIAGYLSPLVVVGWFARDWLLRHYVPLDRFNELKDELEAFKAEFDQRSVADAARHEKLERDYIDLLRALSKKHKQ